GARVYARLVASPGASVPAPVHGWPRAPEALAELLRPLVADADLLVAAASGNPALDAVEASAVAAALGGRRTPVTSIRGAIGDFGAAGGPAAPGPPPARGPRRLPPPPTPARA